MSKFINSSANYSETSLLKDKILRPIINEYNKSISENIANNSILNFTNESKFIVPNNGKKYHLLIINKNNLTEGQVNSQESKYKILYFFPYNDIKQENNYKLENNYNTDYYSEIDSKSCLSKNVYLFEGYLYSNFNYLITDILFMEKSTVVGDYSLRFSLVNEILFNSLSCLKNLNGHFSIGIHPIFEINDNNNENIIMNIFKNNFIFKNEINSVEIICNDKLIKESKVFENKALDNAIKIIRANKYIDVFNVYNESTCNSEGILYIKSITDSKKMIELFKNSSLSSNEIKIKCQYNTHFKKWAPIL